MPAWDEYKAEAKARGSLALELYVAISTPAKPPEELKKLLPDHLAYQGKLEVAHQLAFAGPMSDPTGAKMEGVGLIVYRADNLKAARALADADPMHAGGARTYEMRKWMINEGSFSLTTCLSAQKVGLS